MQLLIFGSIATIIVSLVENFRIIINFYKEVFNEGYKLNDNRINEINTFFNRISDGKINNLAYLFVPGYNLYLTSELSKILGENNEEAFNTLYMMGVIEKMTDYEKIEYERKLGFINGVIIDKIVEEKLENTRIVIVKNRFKESNIVYKGKEVIYKTGEMAEKSDEEVLTIVNNANRELVMNTILDKYGNIDNFCEAVKNDYEGVILHIAKNVVENKEYEYRYPTEEKMNILEKQEKEITDKIGSFKIEIDLSDQEEFKGERVKVLRKDRK